MNNELSIMDAFKALSEMDEDVEINVRKTERPLKEGRAFDISDPHAMEAAKSFNEAEEKEDTELEVIDVDADSIEHLKKKAEYVGQMLLQCKSCKATRFIDADRLQASENNEDVFNLEDECPHCHNSGNGYSLLGQVGKVADETEEEPKLDNDVEKEEATLDNDQAEETQPAESGVEEAPEEPEGEAVSGENAPVSLDNSDGAYDETNATDDTADMEAGKLGDEINDNEFPWDDTEEKPEEEPTEDPLADLLEPKDEKKKDEDLEEEVESEEETDPLLQEEADMEKPEDENLEDEKEPFTFDTLINKYVVETEDEDSKYSVEVVRGDDSEEFELAELPKDAIDAPLAAIGTTDPEIEVVVATEGDLSVADFIATLADDKDTLKLHLTDEEDIDETLSLEDAYNLAKDLFVERIERPTHLILYVIPEEGIDEEELEGTEGGTQEEPEDTLEENIFNANKMFAQKASKPGSDEYWIRESLACKEDLEFIFKNYVLPVKEEFLIRRFKFETGYRDAVDNALLEAYGRAEDYSDWKDYRLDQLNEDFETMLEDTHATEAKPMPDLEACHAAAKELANKEGKPVIYGYCSRGRDFEVEPIVCDNLEKCTADFMKQYHPGASVHVAYPRLRVKVKESAHVCAKCGKEICECDQANKDVKEEFTVKADDGFEISTDNISKENALLIAKEHTDETGAATVVTDAAGKVVTEKVQSFKSRNALALAIKECKNNNQPYNVRRSLAEGYRYDLVLTEEIDEVVAAFDLGKAHDEDVQGSAMELIDRRFKVYVHDNRIVVIGHPENITDALKKMMYFDEYIEHGWLKDEAVDVVIKEGKRLYDSNGILCVAFNEELVKLTDTLEDDKVEEQCDVEFNEEEFDKNINEYFDSTYDECVRYITESGTINEHGQIVLEGYVTYGNDALETSISFTLTPSNKLVEGVTKTIYTVTNSLSDETFECEME